MYVCPDITSQNCLWKNSISLRYKSNIFSTEIGITWKLKWNVVQEYEMQSQKTCRIATVNYLHITIYLRQVTYTCDIWFLFLKWCLKTVNWCRVLCNFHTVITNTFYTKFHNTLSTATYNKTFFWRQFKFYRLSINLMKSQCTKSKLFRGRTEISLLKYVYVLYIADEIFFAQNFCLESNL